MKTHLTSERCENSFNYYFALVFFTVFSRLLLRFVLGLDVLLEAGVVLGKWQPRICRLSTYLP
jgi:hypothetical protein